MEEDHWAKRACKTVFLLVCLFTSKNERSQIQLLDVWNGSWVQLLPTDNTYYEKTSAEANKTKVQKQIKEAIKVRLFT